MYEAATESERGPYPVQHGEEVARDTAELHLSESWLSGSPIIRIGLAPSGKFVQNSTKLTCLEITGYQIKYSTVLWLIEFQIRRGPKV